MMQEGHDESALLGSRCAGVLDVSVVRDRHRRTNCSGAGVKEECFGVFEVVRPSKEGVVMFLGDVAVGRLGREGLADPASSVK